MRRFLILAPLLLTACYEDTSDLKQRIEQLENSLKVVKNTQYNTYLDIYGMKERFNSSASFTPADKGYAAVWTPAGNLLVSLVDIEKYASGYRLTFKIGNPTLAIFHDVKLKVSWNRAFQDGENYQEWNKNEKQMQQSLMEDIRPGQWNMVRIIISPAKEEETGYINLELKTDEIRLYK